MNALTMRWDETQPPTSTRPPAAASAPRSRPPRRAASRSSSTSTRCTRRPSPAAEVRALGEPRGVRRPDADPAVRRVGRDAVARTFPTVHEFVVMNECNQPLFVNPQWDASGQNQSAAICGRALAAAYDALKGVSTANFVWGVGLSPRGQRRARTPPATPRPRRSTFLGDARHLVQVRSSPKTHRTAPLMDGLDFHPYPVPQSLPFATGYANVRDASVSNLPRIYQAFYDGVQRHAAADDRPAEGRRAARQPQRDGDPDRTRSARPGYVGTEVSANAAGGVVGELRDRGLPGDLVPADAHAARLRPERRASSTSSTWSTSRTSPAGRAASTGSGRPGR